ncbi:MAG: hypothetical protein KGK14_04355 [Bacteroidota bacterium]|nr:hypothetical protein [Bacteroidota bacterium]
MATIPYTFLSGTFNGLTFYVVNGRQLVRSKTSIDKKRFYSDPAFARLRQYSQWLQIASPVASKIYRQLPPQKGLQQKMTGQLMQWLKKGVNLAVAVQRLIDAYIPALSTAQSAQPVAYGGLPTKGQLWYPNLLSAVRLLQSGLRQDYGPIRGNSG